MNSNHCPCGRPKSYVDCCALAHANPIFIKTAEDLMRSRYTAFTMANGPYLIETHHSETRKNVDQQEIVDWAKSVEWVRLDVLNTTLGKETDETGTVEFKAYFKEKNQLRYLHENSFFKREYGVWKYVGML
ncbi:MAG: YchJ family metal-binding protein [Crocinitomicaceae bacterium]